MLSRILFAGGAAAAMAAQQAVADAAKDAGGAAPVEESLASSIARYLGGIWAAPGWLNIVLARLVLILATFVVAWLVLKVVKYLLTVIGRRILEVRLGLESRKRAQTLAQLFYSIARYVIYFLAFITALYQANINPAPFLGGAAVIGLAVGFGSQDLVKDIVTGIFILIENQFSVGEYVNLGGKTGVVTAMTVRTVTVRDDQGRIHNLPYRSITVVSNFTRSSAALILDVFLAEPAAGEKAAKVLEGALNVLLRELSPMARACLVEGVVNPGTPQAHVRCRIETRPNRVEFLQAQAADRIKQVLAAES
ncbi:MAG: mechanosensitive ion channel family protein, partial [Planctomycetota bacterium]